MIMLKKIFYDQVFGSSFQTMLNYSNAKKTLQDYFCVRLSEAISMLNNTAPNIF